MNPSGSIAHRSIVARLALFVRDRRRANGLTQTELALLAGVGRRFVSELENSKTTLRLDKVEAVLQVFGRTLSIVAHRYGGLGDDR